MIFFCLTLSIRSFGTWTWINYLDCFIASIFRHTVSSFPLTFVVVRWMIQFWFICTQIFTDIASTFVFSCHRDMAVDLDQITSLRSNLWSFCSQIIDVINFHRYERTSELSTKWEFPMDPLVDSLDNETDRGVCLTQFKRRNGKIQREACACFRLSIFCWFL
jgi:hypothetical protein